MKKLEINQVWRYIGNGKNYVPNNHYIIVAIGEVKVGEVEKWQPSVTYMDVVSYNHYTRDTETFLKKFEPMNRI